MNIQGGVQDFTHNPHKAINTIVYTLHNFLLFWLIWITICIK